MVGRQVLISAMFLGAALTRASAQGSDPPKTVWDTDQAGTAIHLQSGLRCPKSSGGFARNRLALYDQVGFDVSCSYHDAIHGDITLYLIKRDPAGLAGDFDLAVKAVSRTNPGATPRAVALAPPDGFTWMQAEFEAQAGKIRGDVFYAPLAGWEYEVRTTYPPGAVAAVAAAIADLTGAVAKSAGPAQTACAASPPPPRAGQKIVMADNALMALAMSGTGLAVKIATASPGSGPAPVWCAELGFAAGGDDYVYWRNIAPQDKGGPVDRITAIDGGRNVTILLDSVGPAIASETAPAAPRLHAVHDVMVEADDGLELAGIYDGRPGVEEIANLVLLRTFGVFARIAKDDNKVTLYAPPR